MKRIYFIGCLIVSLMACERVWYDEYVIKNETNHTIEIIGYFEQEYTKKRISETHSISPIKELVVLKSVGFRLQDGGVFTTTNIDSVQIIFDNNRVITQSCNGRPIIYTQTCVIERNIMGFYPPDYSISTMSYRKGSKRGNRFEYSITESDYQRAVLLKR